MKLFNGCCEEVLKSIPDASVDAVITDPPYGRLSNSNERWDKLVNYGVVCKELKRICKPKAPVILFSDYKEMFNMHKEITENGFTYRYFFTWNKPNTFSGFANVNVRPLNNVEQILVFSPTNENVHYYADGNIKKRRVSFKYAFKLQEDKTLLFLNMKEVIKSLRKGEVIDGVSFIGRKSLLELSTSVKISMKSVLAKINEFIIHDDYIERDVVSRSNVTRFILEYPAISKKDRLHPTQKPVDLMKKLVELYTKEGDTVLDFTMRKWVYW